MCSFSSWLTTLNINRLHQTSCTYALIVWLVRSCDFDVNWVKIKWGLLFLKTYKHQNIITESFASTAWSCAEKNLHFSQLCVFKNSLSWWFEKFQKSQKFFQKYLFVSSIFLIHWENFICPRVWVHVLFLS